MQEFKEREPGLRDALPLKKAQELASGQLGALRDARGRTGLGMIMLHKAETERRSSTNSLCAASSCPRAGMALELLPYGSPTRSSPCRLHRSCLV